MGTLISQEIPYSGVTLSQQSTPIGAIIPYMGTTAPSGYLACDGTVYAISLYPLLAGFIEAQFGSINYFGGDGTSTFAVPNLQGEFLRGAGTNSHTNQGAGGTVGQHQDGTEIPNIAFDTAVRVYTPSDNTIYLDKVDSTIKPSTKGRNTSATPTNEWASIGFATATSRPTNTSVLYIIKAKSDRLDKITFAEVDDTSVSSDAVWSAEKIANLTPIGKVDAFFRNTAPYGYLKCDGSTYNIADYPLLAALFNSEFGSVNVYGGDGTTTFAVPNLQGEFLRGAGTNGHTDQGDGATVGTHQDATLIPNMSVSGTENTFIIQRFDTTKRVYISNPDSRKGSFTYYLGISGTRGTVSADASEITSRPTNTSVLYCISAYR